MESNGLRMHAELLIADYSNPDHATALIFLMNAYATDPMGGGEALDPQVLCGLPAALAALPRAFTVLAYIEQQPAGLINCLGGFSTFKCQPLINIHDVVVLPAWRGQGLAGQMLAIVEARARSEGCCKLTLEVLEGNQAARKSYTRSGFAAYALDPAAGQAQFWQKLL